MLSPFMELQRAVQNAARHQRNDGDNTAVARGKLFFTRPDLAEQHIVIQFCKFRRKFAEGISARCYFFYKDISFCFVL